MTCCLWFFCFSLVSMLTSFLRDHLIFKLPNCKRQKLVAITYSLVDPALNTRMLPQTYYHSPKYPSMLIRKVVLLHDSQWHLGWQGSAWKRRVGGRLWTLARCYGHAALCCRCQGGATGSGRRWHRQARRHHSKCAAKAWDRVLCCPTSRHNNISTLERRVKNANVKSWPTASHKWTSILIHNFHQ